MLGRPMFVIGTMRSGSTLFRLILDAHPHISISEETGFMGALAATKTIPNWKHGAGWYERIGWTEDEFDARLREFYSGLFERHARVQGKQRWGEKTPFHAQHMAQMATVFPDAVFVGIVRHPGAVVHSLMRKFHYAVEDAVTYWDDTNKEILQRGLELGGDRFALLRYEDLVAEPEATLRELVDWLGEPWSDDLLRHNDVQAARGAPRLSAGTTRTRDPIMTELADRWAEALQGEELDLLVQRTGPLAAFFGYDPERPGAPGPLVLPDSEGRSRLLTGAALADKQRGSHAVPLDDRAEAVIMPDMNPAELAKRLQQAEAALRRVRSRRAVRWSDALRRAQRRAAGLPDELRGAVGKAGRGPTARERG
ncbi:sulfotransferase family protein [Blastococcus colisei]|uniref:Sulfotransferase family protein n=1 Tax=Blastococcus colisei TaxID=1564162 RepID=A0A543P1D3_9ACTN|nr:sulfotransferase [Blastococcus colisei]TQN37897.1 sulfotransferase family protein [Blastococcus colisei]